MHTLHRLLRNNLDGWKWEVQDLQMKVCPKAFLNTFLPGKINKFSVDMW